jgi:hypothetical protein
VVSVWDGRKVVEWIIEEKSTPESVKHIMQQKQIEYNVKLKKTVVLADDVIDGTAEGFTKELDINGATCVVTINKVNK